VIRLGASERDLVLEHVRQFRMTTQSVVAKLFCAGSDDAARKLLSRMSDQLASGKLHGNVRYYQLNATSARSLGAPEEAGKPLGPQALPTAFGILGFCCLSAEKRFRYTRPEFAEDFPELVEPLGGRRYYLDHYIDRDGDTARLGHILIDLDADVGSLVEKCREKMRAHLRRAVVKQLVLNDLVRFGLVVAEPEKKRALDEAFRRESMKISVRVEVVEELGKIPRARDAAD